MKKTLFIILGIAGILVAIAASLVIWFVVQQEYMHPNTTSAPAGQAMPAVPAATPPATQTEGTTTKRYFIPADRFTSAQKTAASAFGIDLSNGFTVTQAMYTCAVGKLGATRMQAIINGATPSLSEGMALYSCK